MKTLLIHAPVTFCQWKVHSKQVQRPEARNADSNDNDNDDNNNDNDDNDNTNDDNNYDNDDKEHQQ